MRHLPALDGLRGLAVLGVLLFHDDRLRGGYLGVDLFFVLSGFLITSLLVREHQASQTIDFKAFWVRRARRLLPAVLALLPVVALYARYFADAAEQQRIRLDGVATLAYVANWRNIFAERSYWQMFEAPSPLEHTWSLAIEEQFYVLWPLIAWFALRRFGARGLLTISAVLAVCSMAAMAWLSSGDTSRAYLGTDTRGAAILLGCVLGCVLGGRDAPWSDRARRALDLTGLAALGLLGFAWLSLDGENPLLYRGGFWLTELFTLALIAATTEPRSLIVKLLSFAPLRWLGLVSYGIYLWHWPIFVLLSSERTGLARGPLSAARFLLTFGVALASYRLLEQPIRRGGLGGRRAIGVALLAVGLNLAALFGLARGGAPPALVALAAPPAESPPGLRDRRDLPPPVANDGRLRVLVVGDSVSQALGERMFFVESRTNAYVAERGVGDCSILEGKVVTKSLTNVPHGGGNCARDWQKDAAELKPDVALVVLGGGFFAPLEIDGSWLRVCDDPARAAYTRELVLRLKEMKPHVESLWITVVPRPIAKWEKPLWDEQTRCFNQAMRDAAAETGASLLELGSKLCPGEVCQVTDQGGLVRPDGMHFGGIGAEAIAEWTLLQLGAVRAPSPRPVQ